MQQSSDFCLQKETDSLERYDETEEIETKCKRTEERLQDTSRNPPAKLQC